MRIMGIGEEIMISKLLLALVLLAPFDCSRQYENASFLRERFIWHDTSRQLNLNPARYAFEPAAGRLAAAFSNFLAAAAGHVFEIESVSSGRGCYRRRARFFSFP